MIITSTDGRLSKLLGKTGDDDLDKRILRGLAIALIKRSVSSMIQAWSLIVGFTALNLELVRGRPDRTVFDMGFDDTAL
jgi:hypothetical protein